MPSRRTIPRVLLKDLRKLDAMTRAVRPRDRSRPFSIVQEGSKGAKSALATDRVIRALCEAQESYERTRDIRKLRLALLKVLGFLDE